jgi:L-fuculose-phosphate aldolase
LFIYRERPDIHAVVHVHPPHATAFAIAHRELPKCVLPEVEVLLGEIPLAPYRTTGTWEFARSVAPWVRTHDAMLLTNHGAVTMGQDPFDAYYKMETLDQYCRILLLARQLGDWNRIDLQGMHDLLRLKERLGLRDPRTPEQLCGDTSQPSTPPLLPAEPYRPHHGVIEDSPKVPALPVADPGSLGVTGFSSDEYESIVAEVLRRLRAS